MMQSGHYATRRLFASKLIVNKAAANCSAAAVHGTKRKRKRDRGRSKERERESFQRLSHGRKVRAEQDNESGGWKKDTREAPDNVTILSSTGTMITGTKRYAAGIFHIADSP